ncbi:alkaline phosphatase family protein [Mycolicibacterium sp. S2-37]|uniref:alkaline phosphatase family protein n=1 Tax=Mycolicibacterium sp. S2-37 TaxID=2810297 RepID=UPI001A93F710|nr:alkaline phosphatase family protein [Mycolicibacterium sp. S2-37]MBO0681291.1 alkaline phosphatase family protein [Mycolicibacterium sp. S2-37]
MSPTVVFVVLDGVGARWVRPDTMPVLHTLATSGAWRPDGSEAVLCSATYPNILTLVTGRSPSEHRVFANPLFGHRITDGAGVRTIFERAGSRTSEFVVGDQNLIDVAKGRTAGQHWPPEGILPATAMRDQFEYATDAEVLPHALSAVERRPDLLVVHLNGPDTACHVHGPESSAAREAYRTADAVLASLADALQPRWDELLLLIASDHDQESIHDDRRIDLVGLAEARGVDAAVFHEGTAAVVIGSDADDVRWLADVPGIEQSWHCEPGLRVVAAEPYCWFAARDYPARRGAHGGPRTRSQVAVAAGGHPMVAQIADSWRHRRPRAEDWADLALEALGL